MRFALALLSLALIGLVLVDGFEAMVLPRRVMRAYRPARLFYRAAWAGWRLAARRLHPGRRRETFLSLFGPLSLLTLFATWVGLLITGFALLHFALGTPVTGSAEADGFFTYLYLSGVTFFTLGYSDLTPAGASGRVLAVVEAGIGFGFIATIIGYLPALYQAFSRREVTISLLDARAGSPPSAAQFLLRLAKSRSIATLDPLLAEWERWAAELLESHLSYPVLSYYRSQHDNQSWLAAVTAMLDTCSLVIVGVRDTASYQAQLTFAMARHAVVDLALVFRTPPAPPADRLPLASLEVLRHELTAAGLSLREGAAVGQKLAELRALYEPFVHGLAEHFLLTLPSVVPEKTTADNWQTTAWARRSPGIGQLPPADEHFD